MINPCWTYEFCDTRLLTLPERSRLFGPEPCGLGTLQVEGIHSYISRLAQAHGVQILTLAKCLDSFLPGSVPQQRLAPANNIASHTHYWTRERIQILERLTARSELHSLTLLKLSHVIEDKRCWRHSRAWCPQCYAQWQDDDQPIYQPLAWSLNVVPMCSRHQVWLSTKCPMCQRPQSLYSTHWPLGCCTACGEWLGSHSTAEARHLKSLCQEPQVRTQVLWQQWASDSVADLLRAMASETPEPSHHCLPRNLKHCLDQVQARPIQLARWIGVPEALVDQWLDASLKPTFSTLLLVASALSVPLVALVLGSRPMLAAQWQPLPSRTLTPGSRQVQRKEIIRLLLDRELERCGEDCSSLNDIASRVNCSVRYLWSHFPIQCNLIHLRRQNQLTHSTATATNELNDMLGTPEANSSESYLDETV